MKRYIVPLVVLLCTVFFTACVHYDEPEEPTVPENPIDVSDFPRLDIVAEPAYNEVGRDKVTCTVTISENQEKTLEATGTIHLRGNSTSEFPKKPFALKFNKKQSVLGMPAAKSWVLLANYFDKTMIRNALAFQMGADSRLEWTPKTTFVELYYNGVHYGTYQLCEKVQVNANRLNLAEGGWLLEVDARAAEPDLFFCTGQMECPLVFHEPEAETLTAEMQAIMDFVIEAETALFSNHFQDEQTGWRHYLDEESWIDWLLVNEIAKNTDAIMYSSCYLHSTDDGKIAAGPLWDFDLGYGNCTWNEIHLPTGWHVRNSNWYKRLFADPAFAAAVKTRFEFFYNNRETYYQFIRTKAELLHHHADANEQIWHTMNKHFFPNPAPCGSYDQEVEGFLTWLDNRFEWMRKNW